MRDLHHKILSAVAHAAAVLLSLATLRWPDCSMLAVASWIAAGLSYRAKSASGGVFPLDGTSGFVTVKWLRANCPEKEELDSPLRASPLRASPKTPPPPCVVGRP